jgi:hypothetical protein
MKARDTLKKTAFVLLMAFSFGFLHGQDEAAVKSLIESKRFIFKVQTIQPFSGIVRQSLNEYDVRLYGDSLISQLPYFGRAFTAPMPGERGGFYFTSTDLEYSVKARKKGGWDIILKPKDVRDVREYFLSVSEKGYTNLRVTSTNRQPMSYSGILTPLQQ